MRGMRKRLSRWEKLLKGWDFDYTCFIRYLNRNVNSKLVTIKVV